MNMPDFENMSPEEAMRWMESLAKRQGANAEEFLTSADDEIDELDADTVVDEPGYTPFGEKPKPKQEAAQSAAPEPEPDPEPEPEPDPTPDPPAPAAAPTGGGTPDFDNMSPEETLRWMESLAKRQGAKSEEFLTTADDEIDEVDANTVVDEPGYTPFGEKPKPKDEPAQSAPEPEPEPVAEPAAEEDLDWLSSLAGDDADDDMPDLGDLDTLAADLEGALGASEEAEAQAAQEEADAMAWLEGLTSDPTEPEPAEETPEPTAASDDEPLGAGVDSMEWLESLARRQGVKDEELLTGGNMQIPDAPDEGDDKTTQYEAYDVDEEGTGEPVAEQNTEDWLSGLAQGDDTPTESPPDWLGGLDDDTTELEYELDEEYYEDDDEADYIENDAEEYMDASDPAAWLGDMADDPDVQQRVGFDPDPEPEPAAESGDDIADMLNRGETPDAESLQAWMGSKMDELLSSPPLPIDEDEDEADAPEPVAEADDPDATPVPGEIPDWLQQMQPTEDAETESAGEMDPFALDPDDPDAEQVFEESPVTDAYDAKMPGSFTGSDADPDEMSAQEAGMPDFLAMEDTDNASDIFAEDDVAALSEDISAPDVPDMPDWLREDIPMDGESLADIFDTGEEDAIEEEPEPAPRSDEVDEDLVARFSPEGGDFEEDPWVQAIREEQEYNYQTDTLPQWYEERIDDPEILAKFQALEGDALAEVELPDEDDLDAGEREPIPDWFNAATTEAATAEAIPDDVPGWLMEDIGGDENMPDWLADADTSDVDEEDVPAWLTEPLPDDEETIEDTPKPAPPIETVEETPEPQPDAVATQAPQPASSPVPVPAAAQQIDVNEAFNTARQRIESEDIGGAMAEYEAVIRANTRLDEVVADVQGVLKKKDHKDNAAAHRVLGDALMRQGKLQEALNTYRRALNLL